MAALNVFAFGKLPAHGDFVARGLGPAERDAWDEWASEGVGAARDALGADFDALHDTTPPWRFAFGPGPFGDGWRAGALTPSIDRAGRRFIVVLGAQSHSLLTAEGAGGRIAEALEEAIYATFAGGGDIDALVAAGQVATADIETDPTAQVLQAGQFWTPDPAQVIVAPQPPSDLLTQAMAHRRSA